MKYLPRVIDKELKRSLSYAGAVLIDGPKSCGKTESARQTAKSELRVDTDPNVELTMLTEPQRLLQGKTPRLLDEWQEQPNLWNLVRHEVDNRQAKGQFILTGSAKPVESAKLHSGAGRFARLHMRPMSWWELGFSSGEVSLQEILSGVTPKSDKLVITLEAIAQQVARGGWPGQLDMDTKQVLAMNRNYLSMIAEIDISRVSERRRDPVKVARLLQSYARNTAIPASITALATDVVGGDTPLNRETISDYIDALSRLMIIEDLPAWSAHLRSRATLRTAPKRYLVDPSLAVAALGADINALLDNLVFLGYLFEAEVVRDLRIYTQLHEGQLRQYRDSNKNEVDIVVQYPNGSWAAFEVKLAFGAADDGAKSLLRMKDNIDIKTTGECLGLTVITGFGFAHRRSDGVNVVPLATLRP
ncbi:ATPase AAA [Actinomycetota bacterium]|nr:ATPase AAA [Actinomycetota bacterium]